MKTLLTGAAGFVGLRVLRALQARGDEVVVLVHGSTERLRMLCAERATTIIEGDVGDATHVRSMLDKHRPDAVVHAAWYAHPSDYLSSPRNIDSLAATARFSEQVVEAGCRKFVGVGTCLEYAVSDHLHSESDATDPRSLYASCKLSAWLVARSLARGGSTEVAWARLFHIHGPGEHPQRLIPSVAAALKAGRSFDLSPGLQVRDHLHVDDVAAALVCLTQHGVNGVFNVCSGNPVTLREVLLAVGRIVGRPELLRFGARPYAPDEMMFLAGDSTRLTECGWTPRHTDLEAGLRDALGDTPSSGSTLRGRTE